MEKSSCTSTPEKSDDNIHQKFVNQITGETTEKEKVVVKNYDNRSIINPLEMDEIVHLIVRYVDGKSLKSCLMISKLWNAEGMKFFFKNNFIKIPKKLAFNLEHEEIQLIKKLQTSFSSVIQFPNALIRDPRDIEVFKKHNILKTLQHVKESLKEFEIEKMECIEKVLEECPNLTLLENSEQLRSYGMMKKCIETTRSTPLTIANVNIEFWDSQRQIIDKFINSGVHVINLRIYGTTTTEDITSNISDMMGMILHSSKDCLKNLTFLDGSFTLVKSVPVMLDLESLSLNINTQSIIPGLPVAFPHGFRFDTNCPNLKTLYLSFDNDIVHNTQHDTKLIFSATGPAPSVKSLTVNSNSQIELYSVCQTFSQIDKLDINCRHVTDFKSVWTFCGHLKSLSIWFHGSEPLDYINLLANMTGRSNDYITSIWYSSSPVKIHPFRDQPSIIKLQDLQTLSFRGVMSRRSKKIESKFLTFLKDVTVTNMPKLKTIQ